MLYFLHFSSPRHWRYYVSVSPACHDNTSLPLDTAGWPDTGCNVPGPTAARYEQQVLGRMENISFILLGSVITDTPQAYL